VAVKTITMIQNAPQCLHYGRPME